MPRLFIAPCLLAAALACGSAQADTLASQDDVRALAERVMVQAGAGHTDDAYAVLAPYALMDLRSMESARSAARGSRMAIEARVGASMGYEFIRMERVGNSLIKLSYIEKTERQAIPWQFIFYKTPAGWGLNALTTGDNVDRLFEH